MSICTRSIGNFWLSAFPGQNDIIKENTPDMLAVFGEKCKSQFIEEGFDLKKVTVLARIPIPKAFKYK